MDFLFPPSRQIAVVICTILSGILCADISQCPDVVHRMKTPTYQVDTFGHMCYAFVNSEKTWVDARKHCEKLGGRLVSIRNSGIMNFIRRKFLSLRWRNNGVWNGANDIDGRGWKWTTGERLGWTYWEPGEPSKMFGLLSIEDCACMRRNDGWRWHDYPCDGSFWTYKYICEFPMKGDASSAKQGSSSVTSNDKDENPAFLIGVILGGVVLGSAIFLAVLFLYRKKRRQKLRNEEPSVRFQNLAYAQVDQLERDSRRPGSNVYMDTNVMSRLYEEINKQTEYGINTLGDKGACCACGDATSESSAEQQKSGHTCKHSPDPDDPPPSYDEVAEFMTMPPGACGGTDYVDMATKDARKPDDYLEPNNARIESREREYVDMNQKQPKNTNLQVDKKTMIPVHKPSNLELTHIYNNEDHEDDNSQHHQTEAKREEAYAELDPEDPLLSEDTEEPEHDPVYEEIGDISKHVLIDENE